MLLFIILFGNFFATIFERSSIFLFKKKYKYAKWILIVMRVTYFRHALFSNVLRVMIRKVITTRVLISCMPMYTCTQNSPRVTLHANTPTSLIK